MAASASAHPLSPMPFVPSFRWLLAGHAFPDCSGPGALGGAGKQPLGNSNTIAVCLAPKDVLMNIQRRATVIKAPSQVLECVLAASFPDSSVLLLQRSCAQRLIPDKTTHSKAFTADVVLGRVTVQSHLHQNKAAYATEQAGVRTRLLPHLCRTIAHQDAYQALTGQMSC